MPIKLNKEETTMRNELIFAADAKAVNIDNTLVNLFMLLNHNGIRPKMRPTDEAKSAFDIDRIKRNFFVLEEMGEVSGFKDNPDAVEWWIRTNLINLVNRGKHDEEKLSALRPIHLESYKVRNPHHARDYFTADQVYFMLGINSKVKEDLKKFLSEGWDKNSGKILNNNQLDIDSLGILHLVKNIKPGFLESQTNINRIKPILDKQSILFCEDVEKLLVYHTERLIPRNVLIDYLKTLISFHLSLYLQKLIHFLPVMVNNGEADFNDDWNIVVDATDSYESKVSSISIGDSETLYNKIYDYVKATFQINAALRYLGLDKNNSENLEKALYILKNKPTDFEVYFKTRWHDIVNNLDDDDKDLISDIDEYDDSYFEKYIEFLIKVRGGYQYRFHTQLIDNLSQKNTERGILTQGRSKKHPRRFIIGTRLLETLVQILVLDTKDGRFVTRSMSIDELTTSLRNKYGLIINGLDESRFKNANIETHLAFKENLDAFKTKLRQIGFYNDLSDAYILQRVRPRYEIAETL